MQPHPAAALFPAIDNGEFDDLVADIREHGLRNPIVVTDGLILDGRNRWRACQQLGIEPVIVEWDRRGTPEAFVVSENLFRRHLTDTQRAMIAAKIATAAIGYQKSAISPVSHAAQLGDRQAAISPLDFPPAITDAQRAMVAAKVANRPLGDQSPEALPDVPISQAQAAAMLNVSDRTLRDAKTVQTKAIPEVVTKVQEGVVPLATAVDIAKLPEPEQREVIRAIETSKDTGRAVRKHVPAPPPAAPKAPSTKPTKPAPSTKPTKPAPKPNGKPKPKSEADQARIATMQRHALIWGDLRAGLEHLCALPLPADVAKVTGQYVRRLKFPLQQHVASTIKWLREFEDAINAS